MEGKYPKHIEGREYELSDGTIVEWEHKAKKKQRELYRKDAKFTAVYKYCGQIGPEDFRSRFETKQLSPDTTIRELQEWYAERNRGRMNITISEEWDVETETNKG